MTSRGMHEAWTGSGSHWWRMGLSIPAQDLSPYPPRSAAASAQRRCCRCPCTQQCGEAGQDDAAAASLLLAVVFCKRWSLGQGKI